MGYKIAVVGATGNVGHEILKILDERNFPVDDLVALASARSVGKEVSFGDSNVKVQDLGGHPGCDLRYQVRPGDAVEGCGFAAQWRRLRGGADA